MLRRENKLLALGLSLVLLTLPLLTNAQEASSSASTTESVPNPVDIQQSELSTLAEVIIANVPTQEATSTQESIPSGDLESTSNPQPSTIEVVGTTTTTAVIPDVSNNVDATTTVLVIPDEVNVVETIEATTTAVTELPEEVLEPQKEYTFDINGSGIATKENPEWTLSLEEKVEAVTEDTPTVTDEPYIDVESGPNTLSISGVCSDPYFVVLLYKNEKDYDNNPSSYLYNRAFPCENGHYDYSLSSLPFSLETDTYYLLVAGQGEKGPWRPISAMIPVGITVKTIIPKANGDELEP